MSDNDYNIFIFNRAIFPTNDNFNIFVANQDFFLNYITFLNYKCLIDFSNLFLQQIKIVVTMSLIKNLPSEVYSIK